MNQLSSGLIAHRAALLHFLADPGDNDESSAYEYFADGLLLVENGHIVRAGPAKNLLPTLPPSATLIEHHDKLIVPGFIDTHIHYPQTDVIASAGKQLLDWLENYTFPAEQKFVDAAHGDTVADFFLRRTATQWHYHSAGIQHRP